MLPHNLTTDTPGVTVSHDSRQISNQFCRQATCAVGGEELPCSSAMGWKAQVGHATLPAGPGTTMDQAHCKSGIFLLSIQIIQNNSQI
jgi:hypothetical protein